MGAFSRRRVVHGSASVAIVLGIAVRAPAQATAGFPPVNGAPAPAPRSEAPPQAGAPPQRVGPAPGVPGYVPPGYVPPGYVPPGYVPPGYVPPGYVPPGYVPPGYVPPGYVPPGYLSPGYGPYVAPMPAAPPAPANPLMDEQQRYRQVLGAYQRVPPPPEPETKPEGGYVRAADRSRRRHDGFYFRFGGGAAYGHDAVQSDKPLPTTRALEFTPGKLSGSGGGAAGVTELAVGFTPGAGVAVGIGGYTVTIPRLVASTADPNTGSYVFRVSQLALIAPFVDWYVDPERGFHLEASAGVSTYVAGAAEPERAGPQAQAHTSIGFGLGAGVGYEWWIGDQWSLGILGRFTLGATSGSDDRGVGWTHGLYAPAVLMSATYH